MLIECLKDFLRTRIFLIAYLNRISDNSLMSFQIGYNVFNSLEALLWISIALTLFFRAPHIPILFRNNTLWGGVFFAIFGISDLAEIAIGGIFAPNQYWLLSIKIICVIAFLILFVRYIKIRKHGSI